MLYICLELLLCVLTCRRATAALPAAHIVRTGSHVSVTWLGTEARFGGTLTALALLACVVSGAGAAFCASLASLHTYLIATNQTTYELSARIDALGTTPSSQPIRRRRQGAAMLDTRPPYDKGCLTNTTMLVQAGMAVQIDDLTREFFENEANEEDDVAERQGVSGAIARLCDNDLYSCF